MKRQLNKGNLRTLSRFYFFSILILGLFIMIKCSSSKELINFDDVKNGNQLTYAREIEIDTFLIIWLDNTQYSKIDFNLNELYRDSIFSYFGKQTFENQNLYKIRNETLSKVDYKSIDGDYIKKTFYFDIIPDEDRNKQKKCTSTMISSDFKYTYFEAENSIEIDCHYKVLCDLFIRIIKKDYKAKYNIEDKTLTKIY